jgi:hypothetical protein
MVLLCKPMRQTDSSEHRWRIREGFGKILLRQEAAAKTPSALDVVSRSALAQCSRIDSAEMGEAAEAVAVRVPLEPVSAALQCSWWGRARKRPLLGSALHGRRSASRVLQAATMLAQKPKILHRCH